MKIIGIRIPGQFEDAYLYKGQLLAVTEEMSFRRYRLEEIVKAITPAHSASALLFHFMFLRNDWLNSESFRMLMSDEDISKAFLSLFDRIDPPLIGFNNAEVEQQEEKLSLNADSYLDMEIYNDRLYIGVDSGLFTSQINVTSYSESIVGRPEKRHDAPCINVTARYGTVNASCGFDGLFTAIEYLGSEHSAEKMRQVADRSIRTDWLDYNIVNYPTQVEPSLIHTKHMPSPDSRNPDSQIITYIGNDEIKLDYLLDALDEIYEVKPDTIQYTYNIAQNMFFQTSDSRFYGITLSKPGGGLPDIKHFRQYRASPKKILSTSMCNAGQVIEGETAVYLFAHNSLRPLIEGECLSVRTFSRSRRYKNIVLITKVNEIIMLSVFDETR